jgi:hypothetical protein
VSNRATAARNTPAALVRFDPEDERIVVSRQPSIHSADDFELSVDEHGTPHFVDIRYLSGFGQRHGGNKAAFGLVLGTQLLVLILTLIIGNIVQHLALSNFALAFWLLAPLCFGLVTIFAVVVTYYRRHVAAIILCGGTIAVAAILSGAVLLY